VFPGKGIEKSEVLYAGTRLLVGFPQKDNRLDRGLKTDLMQK
jgi:hypothetical protein